MIAVCPHGFAVSCAVSIEENRAIQFRRLIADAIRANKKGK